MLAGGCALPSELAIIFCTLGRRPQAAAVVSAALATVAARGGGTEGLRKRRENGRENDLSMHSQADCLRLKQLGGTLQFV